MQRKQPFRQQTLSNDTAKRILLKGKGKYGKRQSLCFEYERNVNDNSNDSGFECDWSTQSESLSSWNTSTEDLHKLQHNPSSFISIIPKLSTSHCSEGSRDDIIPKPQINKEFVKNVGLYLPMKKANEEINPESGIPLHLLGKPNNMSPDSTMCNDNATTMSLRESNETMSPPMNSSDGSLSNPLPSPIPMKRPRFCFSSPSPSKQTGLKLRNQNGVHSIRGSLGKRLPPGTIPTLTSNLSSVSRDGRVALQILAQPEEQHRARYQTEGSRGAIKDRKCNGFPTIKLMGYDKPATLQIFIGTDQGKVSPHMFYQACKVTGKSSTPCIEKKVEGTVIIEIEFEPTKDMVISCDCVGILKERNVDVEQRFPFHHAAQSRKKSTKCRMIFRTTIVNSMGVEETLQVSSLPILCTQPPGQPEICKQSMYDCPASGGKELFIIGKNFLKDTKIVIQEEDDSGEIIWETKSIPLKDYLQQTHLICVIPAYKNENITTPIDCKLIVWSGGKYSEPHRFTYFPNITPAAHMGSLVSSNPPCLSDSPSVQALIQNPLGHSLSQHQQVVPVEIQVQSVSPIHDPLVAHSSSTMASPTSGMSPVCHMSPAASGSPVLSNQSVMCSSPVETTITGDIPEQQAAPIGQIPATLTFENNIIATTQQERLVVNELQTLLEQQTSTNAISTMPEVKTEGLISNNSLMDIKPSTTFTTLSPNMSASIVSPMELSYANEPASRIQEVSTNRSFDVPFHQDTLMSTVQLPQVMVSNQSNGISSPSSSSSSSASSPSSASSIQNTIMVGSPQHQQQQQQILMSTAACTTVQVSVPLTSPVANIAHQVSSINMNCLESAMKIESTPQICRNPGQQAQQQQQQQSQQQGQQPPTTQVVFINNGELQGPIANALTQMSDNELLNYINPNAFEGGQF